MIYTTKYKSPLDELLLIANDEALLGVWFENEKPYFGRFGKELKENEFLEEINPILDKAVSWLDSYFAGENPDMRVPYELNGTEFQKCVWKILLDIPYGASITYGVIARTIAREKGIPKMSAQAVGQAVGSNKISILIPCHRVLGANGKITGYGGGIERKEALLKLENIHYRL